MGPNLKKLINDHGLVLETQEYEGTPNKPTASFMHIKGGRYIPVKIFLMVNGLSPSGESLPPSKLNPSPVPSFFKITVTGGPRGTSTNFKSEKKKKRQVLTVEKKTTFQFSQSYQY